MRDQAVIPTDPNGPIEFAITTPRVSAVSLSPSHTFSKAAQTTIRLLAGLGVEGDAHLGAKVKHRYQVRKDPNQPNLCQVHLIQHELLDELNADGFTIQPGQMGENITTRDLDLLSLPTETLLRIGESAVVEVTGLRSPCGQLDTLQPGLMNACFTVEGRGRKAPRAGIMGIVLTSGDLRPGERIRVSLPPLPHRPLKCV